MNNEYLNEATNLVGDKKFKEAKDVLANIDTNDEKNLEAIKLLGLCNINLEDFGSAKNNFETVVKYNPEDATSWMYLAMAYDNCDEVLHAITAYKEVIKLINESKVN